MITIDELIAKILSNTCSNEEFNKNTHLFCNDDNNFKRVCLALHQNTSITHLDFSIKFYSDSYVHPLAEVLKVKTSITLLNLNYNQKTGSEGIKIIVDALKDNTTLKTLCLRNIQEKDEGGADALAEMLKNNRSLTKLEVGGNNFTPVGIKKIIDAIKNNPVLTEFELTRAGITNTDFVAFLLDQLNIARSIADLIKTTRSISHLNLSGNNFPLICVSEICCALRETSTQIISFHFSGNGVNDEGLNLIAQALSAHINLRHLSIDSLSFNSLDSFAKYISNNKELRSLSIKGSEGLAYTPQVFDILEQHPRLTCLKNCSWLLSAERIAGQIQKITFDLLALNEKFVRVEADVIINELVATGMPPALRNIIYLYLGYENDMEAMRQPMPLVLEEPAPSKEAEEPQRQSLGQNLAQSPNSEVPLAPPPTAILLRFNQQLDEIRRNLLSSGRLLTAKRAQADF